MDPIFRALLEKARLAVAAAPKNEPGKPIASEQPRPSEYKDTRYIFLVYECRCDWCRNTWFHPSGVFLDRHHIKTRTSKWEPIPAGAELTLRLPKVTVLQEGPSSPMCMKCRGDRGFPKETVNG